MMLILAMVAAEYLFFGILSPTSWAHNYLEALPFITIIGGIGVDWMIGAGAGPHRRIRIRGAVARGVHGSSS